MLPGLLLSLTLFSQSSVRRPDPIGDFLVAAYLAASSTLLSTAGFVIPTALSSTWRRLRVSRAVIIAGRSRTDRSDRDAARHGGRRAAAAAAFQIGAVDRDGALSRDSGSGAGPGGSADRDNDRSKKRRPGRAVARSMIRERRRTRPAAESVYGTLKTAMSRLIRSAGLVGLPPGVTAIAPQCTSPRPSPVQSCSRAGCRRPSCPARSLRSREGTTGCSTAA